MWEERPPESDAGKSARGARPTPGDVQALHGEHFHV